MKHYLIASWLLLGVACGGDTEGRIIELRWRVEAADRGEGDREFVTDTGFRVQLTEARVAVESLALLAPSTDSAGAIAQLQRLLVPVARAHGGHDEATGRRIRAEWLDPFVFDALADERVSLGAYSAEEGAVEVLKLQLARESDRLPESLDGYQAYVRGSAERDGERVNFAGGLSFAEAEAARRVETEAEFALAEGGTLTLDIHANEWFRGAEFDRLPEAAAPDAEREITPNTQVGRAWAIGIRSPAAFTLTYQD